MRNTNVGAIEDGGPDSWPNELDMDGFTYSRLGGLFEGEAFEDRKSEWFIEWLARERKYSRQPYHQLASVLSSTGHPEKANAILYAAKKREKQEAWRSNKLAQWLGLSLLDWTIGYGFGARYFRSLYWVLGLVALGVFVLGTLPTDSQLPFWGKVAFSLDVLLPIVELDKYDLKNLNGGQLYYFYFHELMGVLLGSFVVAGLSGITKK